MRSLNIILVGILAIFVGISLFIYQANHLKAGLIAFAIYYAVWELMVMHLRRTGEHGSAENDAGQED